MKTYRKCTKKPYSFLTIDTALLASDPFRFRKNLFFSYKMTVTDQIKILGRKIKQNEAQYDLDKKAAKISVLSSGNLHKYQYLTEYQHLTGEGLNYKPNAVNQAKFDYSPLSKFFNKGLKEKKKKKDS